MLRFDKIWQFDNSGNAYIDHTNSQKADSSINFIEDVNDRWYLGLSRRPVGIYCELQTNGSYGSFTYSYWNGSWTNLSIVHSYAFDTSKYGLWLLPPDMSSRTFSDTDPHNGVTPPDINADLYWIRISASSVTTQSTISKIRAIPFANYTTPTKVSNFLQIKKDFDASTKPTDYSVEEFIRRAEDYIDYRTKKSWRWNAVVEETDSQLVDYNRYGIFPRHRNLWKVYSVSLWNGNTWNTLTEGRNNDYFVNYNLGMIYFTRLFLLPAAYGMTGRYFHWGFGEYKNSVKMDYVYGRDPETDTEFYVVEDIATKLVAIDILRHHDYSALVSSGVDKVPLETKIRLLEEQVEQRLDSLTGISLV